jgi:hypothetical protein
MPDDQSPPVKRLEAASFPLGSSLREMPRTKWRYSRYAKVTLMLKFAAFSLGLAASATLLAQTLPPVYLNHVTVFLPAAAYNALLQSSFLRNEFCGFEEQTVQRDGGAWGYTGVYLRGQHTYLEFFKAGPQARPNGTITAPVGLLTFNMWLDDRKQLPLFRDRVAAERNSAMQIVTTRDARNEPAWDSVSRQGPPPAGILVYSSLKGYYPDGVTREKRLEDRYLQGRYLHDVTGLAVTVNQKECDLLLQDFRAYSYMVNADGGTRTATGPGITIRLIPAKPAEPRTLVVDLSMNRAASAKQVYRFEETSELHLEGSAAKWKFTFPDN